MARHAVIDEAEKNHSLDDAFAGAISKYNSIRAKLGQSVAKKLRSGVWGD